MIVIQFEKKNSRTILNIIVKHFFNIVSLILSLKILIFQKIKERDRKNGFVFVISIYGFLLLCYFILFFSLGS